MSKGPGKWQQIILDALEASETVFIRDLLPSGYKHAEYSAIMRAANQLRRSGRLLVVSLNYGWKKRYLAVKRRSLGDAAQLW